VSVITNQLKQFRSEAYQNFNNGKRTDALMDLKDWQLDTFIGHEARGQSGKLKK